MVILTAWISTLQFQILIISRFVKFVVNFVLLLLILLLSLNWFYNLNICVPTYVLTITLDTSFWENVSPVLSQFHLPYSHSDSLLNHSTVQNAYDSTHCNFGYKDAPKGVVSTALRGASAGVVKHTVPIVPHLPNALDGVVLPPTKSASKFPFEVTPRTLKVSREFIEQRNSTLAFHRDFVKNNVCTVGELHEHTAQIYSQPARSRILDQVLYNVNGHLLEVSYELLDSNRLAFWKGHYDLKFHIELLQQRYPAQSRAKLWNDFVAFQQHVNFSVPFSKKDGSLVFLTSTMTKGLDNFDYLISDLLYNGALGPQHISTAPAVFADLPISIDASCIQARALIEDNIGKLAIHCKDGNKFSVLCGSEEKAQQMLGVADSVVRGSQKDPNSTKSLQKDLSDYIKDSQNK